MESPLSINDPQVAYLQQSPVSPSVLPPVETNQQSLPFEQLSWENFERLCVRLANAEGSAELVRLYGERGEDQSGIDIFARNKHNRLYTVYQCKNVKDFGPVLIEKAINKFLEGEWAGKSDKFVLCTRESLKGTSRSKTIEDKNEQLKCRRIGVIPWDKEELSNKLKDHVDIVRDFFGIEWVRVFNGQDAANALLEKTALSLSNKANDGWNKYVE
jgi:hypothetical protein